MSHFKGKMVMDYLKSLQNFGIKLELERIEEIYRDLKIKECKYIHVAGTNGKGSTTAMISSILREAGYSVGMFTSPHLIKYNERIKVDGKEITNEELEEIVNEIKSVLNGREITFFEMTTLIALMYFSLRKVEYAVIEVGLGGRLDATNIITPVVSVITSISLDHTKVLGDTVERIAFEKAGIVKRGVPVVVSKENGVIENICKERGSKFIISSGDYKTSLLGKHQSNNASVAGTVCKELGISDEIINVGLLNVKWPGRIEWVKCDFLVDCAHNMSGMEHFVEYLKTVEGPKALLVGFSEGKEYSKMFALLEGLFDKIVITKGNFKPVDPSLISNKHIIIEDSSKALAEILKFDGVKVCTGSMYLVGDVLRNLNE